MKLRRSPKCSVRCTIEFHCIGKATIGRRQRAKFLRRHVTTHQWQVSTMRHGTPFTIALLMWHGRVTLRLEIRHRLLS